MPNPPVWVICNGCNLSLSCHLLQCTVVWYIRSFLLHPPILISSSFQCSVFIYTFYAPILSDFIFFSSQCSHITTDISLCGPRRRPPHHRLWFWLSGKKLTQLAHENINQVTENFISKYQPITYYQPFVMLTIRQNIDTFHDEVLHSECRWLVMLQKLKNHSSCTPIITIIFEFIFGFNLCYGTWCRAEHKAIIRNALIEWGSNDHCIDQFQIRLAKYRSLCENVKNEQPDNFKNEQPNKFKDEQPNNLKNEQPNNIKKRAAQ